MATMATLSYAKRRKNVYGKANRSTWNNTNVDSFFGDDEDELSAPVPAPESMSVRQPDVKNSFSVVKPEAKAHNLKPAQRKTKDTYDLPSSGDESDVPMRIIPAPSLKPPKLLDDRKQTGAQLTSWEKQRSGLLQNGQSETSKAARQAAVAPEARLKQSSATRSRETQQDVAPVQSAAARLAARKQPVETSPLSNAGELETSRTFSKRSAMVAEAEGTPRKRARMATATEYASKDAAIGSPLTCDTAVPTCEENAEDADVYDIPDSSADETMRRKASKRSPKAASKPARRVKATTLAPRLTPRKGLSAPARLAEMLSTNSDSTEVAARSPSRSTSRNTTPQQPSTPPEAQADGSGPAIRTTGTLTPKQAQLWKDLLPNTSVAPSPSALLMKELAISAKRRTGPSNTTRTLTKSSSDVPRRLTRLVDRLKASAASSDDELTSTHEEDIEMTAPGLDGLANLSQLTAPDGRVNASAQASQSQSQVSATGMGPKITYSRVRSYLPEDSLEDNLVLGLTTDTPEQTRATIWNSNKPAIVSQKLAFDLEDSDSETSRPARIRNIHELRAAGRNIRGAADIEQLLADIENHSTANRSRRRSALIDLAAKLAEKKFMSRFVGQSFEVRLVAECSASSDQIADFLLAAAVALLSAGELPDHAVRSLQEGGVVVWLMQLLEHGTELGKMAKDRRNNMAKSSQTSLLELGSLLQRQPVLWEDNEINTLSPRLIALKALDRIVGRLRRLGDRSPLVDAATLPQILRQVGPAHDISKHLDTALTISVLESLSVTSAPLDWPAETIQGIGHVLPQLDKSTPILRHTLFLALRLCLNSTNNSVRNCRLLAISDTVRFLLQAVVDGFQKLNAVADNDERAVALDLLVLAVGVMINLVEHCDEARECGAGHPDILAKLVTIFQHGQQRMLDAESVEESISNVAYGYLAVMLANLCQHAEARRFIASNLPGQTLGMLVDAVDEFVRHHQKVDTLSFEGEEGKEVWGSFTEKLKLVLARLTEVERES